MDTKLVVVPSPAPWHRRGHRAGALARLLDGEMQHVRAGLSLRRARACPLNEDEKDGVSQRLYPSSSAIGAHNCLLAMKNYRWNGGIVDYWTH